MFKALTDSVLKMSHIHIDRRARGVARIFQREGGGGGGGSHCHIQGIYIVDPLQMFGPDNGVCNYLALVNFYVILILRICAFSPPELKDLYVVYNYLTRGVDGHPRTSPPPPPPSPWLRSWVANTSFEKLALSL